MAGVIPGSEAIVCRQIVYVVDVKMAMVLGILVKELVESG